MRKRALPKPLGQYRLIINAGKGGVGKTVVSAAMALALSRKGKRVLLATMESPLDVAQYLGCRKLSAEPAKVGRHLKAASVSYRDSFRNFFQAYLRFPVLYEPITRNRLFQVFLEAAPGIKELLQVGQLWFWAERSLHPEHRFDTIILDAPAAGHLAALLRAPRQMGQALVGPMKSPTQAIDSWLRNPESSIVNVLAIPEEMPVQEAIELYRTLANEVEIPLGLLILNQYDPPYFNPGQRKLLETVLADSPEQRSAEQDDGGGQPGLATALALADFRLRRDRRTSVYKRFLDRQLPLPCVEIPTFWAETMPGRLVRKVAQILEPSLS